MKPVCAAGGEPRRRPEEKTLTLIGVDIGTQGTKAALFRANGECLAEAFHPSALQRPSPGVVEEDPEKQLESVCLAIRECVKTAGRTSIAAMAIDGQMAGILGIGAGGGNVTPYDSWLDTRCSQYIRRMNEEAGDEILMKTGNAPSFNHGPKILWWMHERPGTFDKIKSFVQPGGYAAMRLCGLEAGDAFIDTTYLHFSGFADTVHSRWDPDLCDRFHLDIGKLPRIVEPDAVVGELTGEMTERCGIGAAVPVVAGCGDTAASFLACGATSEGICVDVAGTASVFASTTESFHPDRERRILGCGRSATPGLWHPYAYINGGGMNLEWFCREIANRGRTGGADLLSLEDLDALAAAIGDDASVPLFVPHLAGRVCPSEPGIRGAWAGLDWSHGLAHLYRAILEGAALEYGVYRNALYPKGALREIRITGGGEKSRLWNRIKASVLEFPVVRINRSLGAPAGAALLAGYGIGLFRSLPEAANHWISLGKRFGPQDAMIRHYRKKLPVYEALLAAVGTLDAAGALGAVSGPDAAGGLDVVNGPDVV